MASIIATPSRLNISRRKGITIPASLAHVAHEEISSDRHQAAPLSRLPDQPPRTVPNVEAIANQFFIVAGGADSVFLRIGRPPG
jgi:hypothetical protein